MLLRWPAVYSNDSICNECAVGFTSYPDGCYSLDCPVIEGGHPLGCYYRCYHFHCFIQIKTSANFGIHQLIIALALLFQLVEAVCGRRDLSAVLKLLGQTALGA